jgi:hypothetical protein
VAEAARYGRVQLGHGDRRGGAIAKSYVSRLLRLALLAPEIVEAILAGRADQALLVESLERPLPASWKEQRERLHSVHRFGSYRCGRGYSIGTKPMSGLKSFTVRIDERLYERLVMATEGYKPRLPKRYAVELALERLLDAVDR